MATKKKSKSSGAAVAPGMDPEYQAECDMKTLIDAEKIKKDKTRLTAAMKKAREQRDAMNSVMGEDTSKMKKG